MSNMMKKAFAEGDFHRTVWDVLAIFCMAAFAAATTYFFLMPSGLTVGCVPGLAITIGTFIPLRVSTITLLVNCFLMILGAILVGAGFGFKTVLSTLLFTMFLAAMETLFGTPASITQDPLVDMLCYVILISISQAVLFSRDASSGGLDIVAKILNKLLHMELGRALSLVGAAVALTSVLTSDGKMVVLSVLGTYLNGMVVDHFIFGVNPRRRVCIISEKEAEIRRFILDDLHSGATIYQAVGAYSNQSRQELIAIVDKGEYRRLIGFLEKVDPDAFVTVYAVNEVFYRPKNLECVTKR